MVVRDMSQNCVIWDLFIFSQALMILSNLHLDLCFTGYA